MGVDITQMFAAIGALPCGKAEAKIVNGNQVLVSLCDKHGGKFDTLLLNLDMISNSLDKLRREQTQSATDEKVEFTHSTFGTDK